MSSDMTFSVKNNSLTRKSTLGKTKEDKETELEKKEKKPETEESEVIFNTDYMGHYVTIINFHRHKNSICCNRGNCRYPFKTYAERPVAMAL